MLYRVHNSPYFQSSKDFSNRIDLSQQKNILDVGCRRGLISQFFAETYPEKQFVAIDNLQSEIVYTQDIKLPNLTFNIADVLNLDCSNQFDAIISFHCLLWVRDKHMALQNIYRALKPGKKAYLQFFIEHGRPKNDRFFYQVMRTAKWKNYFKNFYPSYFEANFSEISGLVQNLGFLIHDMKIVQSQTNFSHTEELQQYIKSWASSYLERIPLAKREHFLHESITAYLNYYHYDRSATFPFCEYFLELECEKPLVASVNDNNYFQYKNVVFTIHEARVLKHFLQGKTAKETSRLLGISAKTVEFHIGKIKEKLNLHSRSQIFNAALEYGFIHLIYNSQI